jgi:hypothetical protein
MGTQPWPQKTSKYKLLIQSNRRPFRLDQFHMVYGPQGPLNNEHGLFTRILFNRRFAVPRMLLA